MKIIATQADVYAQYIVTVGASGLEWKWKGSKKNEKVPRKNLKKMTLNDGYSCLKGGAVMLYMTKYRENLAVCVCLCVYVCVCVSIIFILNRSRTWCATF